MKAWRVYNQGEIQCDELPSQSVEGDCVKIKITYAAISLTDRQIFEGALSQDKLPLIIGREGVGMVTETGENISAFTRGDRVVIDPFVSCLTCSNCKNGKISECEKLLTCGVTDDGLLRDFVVVNENSVYKIPDRIKDSEAVFLEHIAIALNAFHKTGAQKGDHIIIVGANVAGIMLAQIALYHQAVPIVVDTRQDRLDIVKDLGVYYVINSVDTDVSKKIFSLTGGRMAEAVAHFTHSGMPLNKSLSYAGKGAKAAVVGWTAAGEDLSISLTPLLNKQITLTGVTNGSKYMPSAINMLANKSVNVLPLISKEIAFDEVADILKEYKEMPNKYIKVLIKNQA